MPLLQSSHDVLVVGSGPAGSAAALKLAGAGARVAVIEKERLPRYKTCGGGIVRRAARLLPIDLSSAVERHCHAAEMRLLDAGLGYSVRREEPILSTAMRADFDFLLLSAARDAGAEVRFPCEVRGMAARNGLVEPLSRRRSSSPPTGPAA
jgi:flavin-dependent dehydrogenase